MTEDPNEFYDKIQEIADEAAEHFEKHLKEAGVEARPELVRYLSDVKIKGADTLILTFKPENDVEIKIEKDFPTSEIWEKRKEKWGEE